MVVLINIEQKITTLLKKEQDARDDSTSQLQNYIEEKVGGWGGDGFSSCT